MLPQSPTTKSCDDANRREQLTNPFSQVTEWTYDIVNRVTRQDNDNGTYTLTTYDDVSNVTQRIIASVTTNYDYDDIDQLIQEAVVSGTTTNYTYDANGNRATKAIVGGTTETYVNDDADKLTSVTVGGTPIKTFHYDANGNTDQVTTGAGTTYLDYDYENRVRQTNPSGGVTSNISWDAFGNQVSSSGTLIGQFGFAGGWGYQQDIDSGLKLLGHRYYDVSTGKFLSRDKLAEGRNWYVTCQNNPLRMVDPEGLSTISVSLGWSAILPGFSGSGSGSLVLDLDTFHIGLTGTEGHGFGGGLNWGPFGGVGYDPNGHVQHETTTSKAVGITVLEVTLESTIDDESQPSGGFLGWGPSLPGAGSYIEKRRSKSWDLTRRLKKAWRSFLEAFPEGI